MFLSRELIMAKRTIPPKKIVRKGKPAQQGVVLLEALIAVLLFSMGVLALVGLQAAMIKNTSDAKYRAEASLIAQQRIGMIWADPANASYYVETNTDIKSLLPSGTRTVTNPATGQYVVTVTWQQPGQPQHNFTTVATIAGD
jgi:type IV pilus assembly protein PilV